MLGSTHGYRKRTTRARNTAVNNLRYSGSAGICSLADPELDAIKMLICNPWAGSVSFRGFLEGGSARIAMNAAASGLNKMTLPLAPGHLNRHSAGRGVATEQLGYRHFPSLNISTQMTSNADVARFRSNSYVGCMDSFITMRESSHS